jgi:gas vesicle protein
MTNHNQVPEHHRSNVGSALAGLLIGAAAGAAAALLLAPQSGKATREQIKEKSIELRDRTTEIAQDAVDQVRSGTSKLISDGRKKGDEMKAGGQEILADQLGHIASAATSGQKAVQNA